MFVYFLLIRIAALFGHKKARLLVRGQNQTIAAISNRQSAISNPIWFHAASVGEFEQARPLIERLRREHPDRKIILTFFSPSGYEMRRNYNQVDAVYYLPFATRRNARRFIEAVHPSMAVFVKYEFWPAYLRELKKRKIPTYSVSAIFRPKQLFFLPWGKLHLRLLDCFTHIYVQNTESETLLRTHGINCVSVVGDTRFDRVRDVLTANSQKPQAALMPVAQFVEGCQRVIVAGSTWPKDETLLAQYMAACEERMENSRTKLVLVPHEIDEKHMHFLFNLFKGRIVRYSDITRPDERVAQGKRHILQQAQVLIIDTMGLLSSIYRFGQVAYVGGGFGVGIHNTIEAAVYGVPVLFGPNYSHFREAKGLIDAGAAQSVKNYRELETAMDTAFEQQEQMGARAAAYVEAETGAAEKIYKELF